MQTYLKRMPILQNFNTLFRVCAFGSALFVGANAYAASAEAILNIPLERTSTEPSFVTPNDPLDYSMNVYYPSNINSQAPCPVIVVFLAGQTGPGESASNTEYSQFGESLAADGFVVAIPQLLGTATIKVPCAPFEIAYPDVYDSDQPQIEEVRNAIIELANDSASPLYNKVDVNTVGLAGHAFGGSMCLFTLGEYRFPYYSCDLTARPRESYIKAVGTYVGLTYDHNLPPFVPALELPINQGGIPVALSIGEDEIQQIKDDVFETFENLSNGEKSIYVVPHGTRNSILNIDSNSNTEEVKAHRKVVKYLTQFFKQNLIDDESPIMVKKTVKRPIKGAVKTKYN